LKLRKNLGFERGDFRRALTAVTGFRLYGLRKVDVLLFRRERRAGSPMLQLWVSLRKNQQMQGGFSPGSSVHWPQYASFGILFKPPKKYFNVLDSSTTTCVALPLSYGQWSAEDALVLTLNMHPNL